MTAAECFCSRCSPSSIDVVCSRCGEEVRWGHRDGLNAYWHRTDVGHMAILGHLHTEADEAAIQAALDTYTVEYKGKTLTIREYEIAKIKDRVKREAAEREAADDADEDYEPEVIPEPEVRSTSIEKTDERLPGGAKQIWNLAEKHGWRVVRSTYSRGPRVHRTQQKVISISDFLVLGIVLDEQHLWAVGSWQDNKFDFAYTGGPEGSHKVDSRTWKSLIKGETP